MACVIGEITRRILEDGIPVTSQGKRTLCITRNAKIRMVEQVISFHSNCNLPLFSDRKIFVQRWVKLRERGLPQDIPSGIAKLTGRRHRKVSVGNSRGLPATQETSASRQLINNICYEIMPNVEI